MIQQIRNKVNLLRADSHMREVARGMVLAFVLKAVGAGLAFGFNIAVARLLGAEGAGLYFLALSVTAIGSVIGRVGLDNALLGLRFVATHTLRVDASQSGVLPRNAVLWNDTMLSVASQIGVFLYITSWLHRYWNLKSHTVCRRLFLAGAL